MTDIFQEVEEDVRRDQIAKMWRHYGPYVIAAAVGMVIAIGAISAWRSYDEKRRAEEARNVLKASELATTDPRAAADAFAAIAAKGGGYGVVARFNEAATRVAGGDPGRAITIYETLANDAGGDELLRDLASLRAAYLMVDTASLGDLKARLAPAIKDTSPWRFSARELQAFAEMKGGETQSAIAGFEALANDPLAPEGIRGRAADMLGALGKGGPKAQSELQTGIRPSIAAKAGASGE